MSLVSFFTLNWEPGQTWNSSSNKMENFPARTWSQLNIWRKINWGDDPKDSIYFGLSIIENCPTLLQLADPTQLQLVGVDFVFPQEGRKKTEEPTPSFYQREWPYMSELWWMSCGCLEIVRKLSEGCLAGVWWLSWRCLMDVCKVSGGCLKGTLSPFFFFSYIKYLYKHCAQGEKFVDALFQL